MINLDKVNTQIDINNINPAQIVKVFGENQKIIKIVIIVLSLFAAAGIFNGGQAQQMLLRTKLHKATQKLEAISAREKSAKDLSGFKSSLPKEIGQFDLITMISDVAGRYGVAITSLQPPAQSDLGTFTDTNFNFTASSADFRSMMLFLRGIEKSKPPLRVNSWTGQVNNEGKITCNISISNVNIHHD